MSVNNCNCWKESHWYHIFILHVLQGQHTVQSSLSTHHCFGAFTPYFRPAGWLVGCKRSRQTLRFGSDVSFGQTDKSYSDKQNTQEDLALPRDTPLFSSPHPFFWCPPVYLCLSSLFARNPRYISNMGHFQWKGVYRGIPSYALKPFICFCQNMNFPLNG